MKCKHCGQEINDTSLFCTFCGAKVEKEDIQVVDPAKKPAQKMSGINKFFKVVLWILIVSTFIAMAVIYAIKDVTVEGIFKYIWDTKNGFLIIAMIAAIPYIFSYVILFHVFKHYIMLLFIAIGMLFCGLSMIKSSTKYKIIMGIVMALILAAGLFVMSQLKDLQEVINDVAGSYAHS